MNHKEKTTLETFNLAACPITGLQAKIIAPTLPKLPHFALKLENPLATQENAIAVSKLAFSELLPLPPATLSGIILSLTNAYGLRNDKMEAIQANAILSELPAYKLIEVIRFLSSLSSYTIKRIPHFSLEEGQTQTVIHWIADCNSSLQAPILSRQEQERTESNIRKENKTSLTSQDRQQAKELVDSLISDGIIGHKLAILFKQSYAKNQLVLMSDNLRNSLCKYLAKFPDNEDAQALIALYKKIKEEATSHEKNLAQQLESEWELASDSFIDTNIPSKKLTIMEIIAARKEKLSRKENQEQEEDKEEEEAVEDGSYGTEQENEIESEEEQEQQEENEIYESESIEEDFDSIPNNSLELPLETNEFFSSLFSSLDKNIEEENEEDRESL